MPRGRQSQGERALTNAERQARYRARHQDKQLPPGIRYRRPKDKRSRAQRWLDAVAELLALQAEYTAWREGLPEALAAETLQPIVELDLGALAEIVPPAARLRPRLTQHPSGQHLKSTAPANTDEPRGPPAGAAD